MAGNERWYNGVDREAADDGGWEIAVREPLCWPKARLRVSETGPSSVRMCDIAL